jgi:hypothetical protein
VDEETSVMKFGHHSRAYLEGLTRFWGSSVYSSPPYSPYCTLKILMFDPKPFLNPIDVLVDEEHGPPNCDVGTSAVLCGFTT